MKSFDEFNPTMRLRWVGRYDAQDPKMAVVFSEDIGWDCPHAVVLQQLWVTASGEEEWRDIKLEEWTQDD